MAQNKSGGLINISEKLEQTKKHLSMLDQIVSSLEIMNLNKNDFKL